MGFAGKSADQQFDGIYVNSEFGVAGRAYPVGTPEHPVNNLHDALTIAQQRNLRRIYVFDQTGLSLEDDLTEAYEFIGRDGYNDAINLNGKEVYNSIFKNLSISNNLAAFGVYLHITGFFTGNPGIELAYIEYYNNQMPIELSLPPGTYHLNAIEIPGQAQFVKYIINDIEIFDKEYLVLINTNTTIIAEFINPS